MQCEILSLLLLSFGVPSIVPQVIQCERNINLCASKRCIHQYMCVLSKSAVSYQ